MNRNNFLNILTYRGTLDPVQVRELGLILDRYPYFQSVRALQLKGLYQNHSLSYNEALKKTAAYTTDRSVLFDYITSEEFLQHQISERIKERTTAEENFEKQEALQQADVGMDIEEAERLLDPDLFEASQSESDFEKETEANSTKKEAEKPVRFDRSGKHSFSEWLKLTKIKALDRGPRQEKEAEKPHFVPVRSTREDKIIEKFIKESPKISPSQATVSQPSVTEIAPDNRLMTETLAEIYARQKNYDKAIQAYKILILKNPEKSGLFANRIREIELNRENKNK